MLTAEQVAQDLLATFKGEPSPQAEQGRHPHHADLAGAALGLLRSEAGARAIMEHAAGCPKCQAVQILEVARMGTVAGRAAQATQELGVQILPSHIHRRLLN